MPRLRSCRRDDPWSDYGPTQPACNVFVRDMEGAGYKVRHYRGRHHWTGPAVEVLDLAEYLDVTGLTDVRLQRDQLGRGYVAYPVASGKRLGQPDEGESY